MPYTVSHYGPAIPTEGMTLDLAISNPYDACATIESVTRGANMSAVAIANHGQQLQGTAFLSSIYSCHFIYKTVHAEAAGAALEIVGNAADQLFYMAAAEERQADSLALDIPSILIGVTGRDWLTQRLPGGVIIELGADQSRCTGGRQITAASGSIQSGPPGQQYCSWQECMWHLVVPSDDIIVLAFSRFDLECMTDNGVPYDYVKIYDGATELSPLLQTFSCTDHSLVVSSVSGGVGL